LTIGASSEGSVYEEGGQVSGLNGLRLNAPIVGVAIAPLGGGYDTNLLVASDGGVFTLNAAYYGSMGGRPLNAPIVGIVTLGGGYWLVASDGGIFTFDGTINGVVLPDAPVFYGSMGSTPLNSPIVGMRTTSDGKGYWLVAADGGVFAFGDAGFSGSRAGQPLNSPIVGMATTMDGKGYWLVSSDGGIFSYGDASFWGADLGLGHPVIAIADFYPQPNPPIPPIPPGGPEGYCVATTNGQIYCSN